MNVNMEMARISKEYNWNFFCFHRHYALQLQWYGNKNTKIWQRNRKKTENKTNKKTENDVFYVYFIASGWFCVVWYCHIDLMTFLINFLASVMTFLFAFWLVRCLALFTYKTYIWKQFDGSRTAWLFIF